jgi:cytochrome P450
MPTLDLVIRETIRLSMGGTALRRNVVHDLDVADKKVKTGAFVAYQISDAHLNPEIYTNPKEFDPARFLPGREEDKRQTFGFIGWGAGGLFFACD